MVFDDAVVSDGDVAVVADVRVCVEVRWFAVGSPSGVGDACGGVAELSIDGLFERGDWTRAFHRRDAGAGKGCDTGAVVAAILEVLEGAQQERLCVAVTGVTHDSTHVFRPIFCWLAMTWWRKELRWKVL